MDTADTTSKTGDDSASWRWRVVPRPTTFTSCSRRCCESCSFVDDMVHARVLASPHFDTVHHCSCDCRRLKRFSCGSSSNRLLHAAGFPRTSAFRNTTIDACRHMLRVATSFDRTTPTILTRVTHLSLSRVQVVNTLAIEVKGSKALDAWY